MLDLYEKNYKFLMKETKELNQWRSSTFKDKKSQYHQVLPNSLYGFNPIPVKILANYFVHINKLIIIFL